MWAVAKAINRRLQLEKVAIGHAGSGIGTVIYNAIWHACGMCPAVDLSRLKQIQIEPTAAGV